MSRGIPWTSAWGQHWANDWVHAESWTGNWRYQDRWFQTNWAEARRDGHSKNPLVDLGGGVKWRAPSYTARYSAVWDNEFADWYRDTETVGIKRMHSPIPNISDYMSGYTGNGFETTLGRPSWHDFAMNEAITKAYSKLADNQAQLGAALAEARQTASMLGNASSYLLSHLKDLKRSRSLTNLLFYVGEDAAKHIRNTKNLANRHLEYQYGWKPLMQDIYGLAKVLSGQVEKALLLTGKGSSVREVDVKSSMRPWETLGFDEWGFLDAKREGSFKQIHTAKFTGRLSEGYLRTAQQVGVINPLTWAWEVVPWSFVVDWFCPVGNVLESLTAHAGLDFVGGHRSNLVLGGSQTVLTPEWGWGRPYKVGFKVKTYERFAYGYWPYALPYVKSPFSEAHVLNALALWRALHR